MDIVELLKNISQEEKEELCRNLVPGIVNEDSLSRERSRRIDLMRESSKRETELTVGEALWEEHNMEEAVDNWSRRHNMAWFGSPRQLHELTIPEQNRHFSDPMKAKMMEPVIEYALHRDYLRRTRATTYTYDGIEEETYKYNPDGKFRE